MIWWYDDMMIWWKTPCMCKTLFLTSKKVVHTTCLLLYRGGGKVETGREQGKHVAAREQQGHCLDFQFKARPLPGFSIQTWTWFKAQHRRIKVESHEWIDHHPLAHPAVQKWMCRGRLKMIFAQCSCQISEQTIKQTFSFLRFSFLKVCFPELDLILQVLKEMAAALPADAALLSYFILLSCFRASRLAPRWNVSGFSPQMCLAHTGCLKESPFLDFSEIRKSIAQDQHNKSNEPGGRESLKNAKRNSVQANQWSGRPPHDFGPLAFWVRYEVWGDIISVPF